jgi:hypothetical protein
VAARETEPVCLYSPQPRWGPLESQPLFQPGGESEHEHQRGEYLYPGLVVGQPVDERREHHEQKRVAEAGENREDVDDRLRERFTNRLDPAVVEQHPSVSGSPSFPPCVFSCSPRWCRPGGRSVFVPPGSP